MLIEAADFAPLCIRTTARKLILHSPSSYRFERGVDPRGVDWASRRCCELILELAGGRLAGRPVGRAGDPRSRAGRAAPVATAARPGHRDSRRRSRRILAALGCQDAARDEFAYGRSAQLAPRPDAGDRPDRRSRPHLRLRSDSGRRRRADGSLAPQRRGPRAGQSAPGAAVRGLRRSDDGQRGARRTRGGVQSLDGRRRVADQHAHAQRRRSAAAKLDPQPAGSAPRKRIARQSDDRVVRDRTRLPAFGRQFAAGTMDAGRSSPGAITAGSKAWSKPCLPRCVPARSWR